MKFRLQDLTIWQLAVDIAGTLFDVADRLEKKRLSNSMLSALCPLPVRIILCITLFFWAAGCDTRREQLIEGRTMGTTYHVKVVTGRLGSVKGLKEKIELRLDEINRSMSPYLPESEISRFNRFKETGVEFPVSKDFHKVMQAAAWVHALSEGAWDGTVNPLVDLWGFGRAGRGSGPPPADAIASLLGEVGFDAIEVREQGALVKRRASVSLDLSSIAKGYGVDQVADVVRASGFTDFLVEIGGETYAAGRRGDDQAWRVGINTPQPDARPDEIYAIVTLQDQALATSGDYRNFFVKDGVRYSHIIDPRTGYPTTNRVVSASIQGPDCTLADGLATAILVMGAEKGLALIERIDGIEGLIVVAEPDGRLEDHFSTGFRTVPSTPGSGRPRR
jgi:thiamine biosynthesis lipoprotein